jgi:hypothetical protein
MAPCTDLGVHGIEKSVTRGCQNKTRVRMSKAVTIRLPSGEATRDE